MPSDQQTIDQYLKRQEESDSLFCKLFADEVPPNICSLRKRELNGRGEFTCIGCNQAAS